MNGKRDAESGTGTLLDPDLAPRRLREGLVPADTGIFLTVEAGVGIGTVFTLSAGGVYVIGRDGADITLEDDKISRRHAEIGLYGPGAYVIRDLASTNGTRLNGRRVREKAKLEHDDRIRLGDTTLQLSLVANSISLSQ